MLSKLQSSLMEREGGRGGVAVLAKEVEEGKRESEMGSLVSVRKDGEGK
jgi:hypothetical protein